MKYVVEFKGSPLREFTTITQAYIFVHEEYERRWPRSMWGYNEAAAHGLTVVGKPELTPEEARELRAALRGET